MSSWLIAYDIGEPRRLRYVEQAISRYGVRIQNSVFESNVSEDLINTLQKRLLNIIKDDDFIVIIPLCGEDLRKAEKYGIKMGSIYIEGAFAVL